MFGFEYLVVSSKNQMAFGTAADIKVAAAGCNGKLLCLSRAHPKCEIKCQGGRVECGAEVCRGGRKADAEFSHGSLKTANHKGH